MSEGLLLLANGAIIRGKSIGVDGEAFGELVFTTSLSGYEETLSDPSYNGQIVLFTYTHIGNYGAWTGELESDRIWAEGVVVRDACYYPSNAKSRGRLSDLLKEYGIVGIEGVDTRALTVMIREHGTIPAVLVCGDVSSVEIEALRERLAGWRYEVDLVRETTCSKVELMGKGRKSVALLDCGVKLGIVRKLLEGNVTVIRFPAHTSAEEILSWDPDGIIVSNGPGDPAVLGYAIETVRKLMGKVPMMGVCLGHQLISLALGCRTYKMKFGHRGTNHPVKDLKTGQIHITLQNHGYAVDPRSLEGKGLKVRQVSLNDGTIEGLEHEDLNILSTQYHPEGRPGPSDGARIFDEFLVML
ncbi:MAG: glutamine-hydrolyzing carbamoyl-phosphate synthase small subunit [Thaumarchaeota archaeon]|nr:glutamine-hydrolyzing carbamoyl-phosphate synthase small subunit [Candidatus Calditenuaceae archaeon]MDW8041433.1 glutamine-hydrolyzing carbamoyl-phosphate synthase small subunit [Nitrososphaerota archaeon]